MHKHEKLTPIFIGGTGRSGTTILSQFVGSHEEVVNIPMESRFMIDKNGLIDVFDALTRNFSMDLGRVAIRAFEKKLTKDMSNPYKAPYLSWNIGNAIKKQTIFNTTKELIEKLTHGTFEGVDYNTQDNSNITSTARQLFYPANRVLGKLTYMSLGKRLTFLEPSLTKLYPKERMYIPKYFRDEVELLTYFRAFTLNMFSGFFDNKENIRAWSEDTPASILNIEFLSKLFPNAKFIHVTRHPVAVAYSMQKMVWAPNSLEKCCHLLEDLYERLIDIHNQFDSDERYIFLRLEDLEHQDYIDKLSKFIELPPSLYSNTIKIEGKKMNYYKSQMPHSDRDYASKRLEKAINFFGYGSNDFV